MIRYNWKKNKRLFKSKKSLNIIKVSIIKIESAHDFIKQERTRSEKHWLKNLRKKIEV